MQTRKGQAAIEYLMTYGWALLVIAIVIVALYMLTQTQTRTETCMMQTGFVCNDPLPLLSAKSGLTFVLHNKMVQGIRVLGSACTTGSPQQVFNFVGNGGDIPSGSSLQMVIPWCTGSNGAALNLVKGQDFKGYIVIKYRYDNDIEGAERIAQGGFSTTVQ